MWLFLALVVGTISLEAYADNEFDSSMIRELVRRGEILSLDRILQKHPQLSTQRLLDLEVELEDGRIVYELEFLQADGSVVKQVIDAQNGDFLKREEED
jgi:uncharacterized membrane protein YkoI